MLLILEQSRTEFGLRLQHAAERRQTPVLYLTVAEIVSDLTLDFFLSDTGSCLSLNYRGCVINANEISGVYCGINAFSPEYWNRFDQEDADYAAAEMQAIWLAILSDITCPVINRPALDTLAGTVLSTPELFYQAHCLGFPIPLVISLESGKVAQELIRSGIPSQYSDLGEPHITETCLREKDLPALVQSDTHCRVKEVITGRPIWITLIGDESFVSALGSDGNAARASALSISRQIRSRLRTLHRGLSLVLAEYEFRIIADGRWVLCGCTRLPVVATMVYGDEVFDRIIGFFGGGAGARASLRVA